MLSEFLARGDLIFHKHSRSCRLGMEMGTPAFTTSIWYRAAWVVLEAMIGMM
jgi:hypothetical protein